MADRSINVTPISDPLDLLAPAVRDAAVQVAIDTDSVFVSRKGTALAVDRSGDVWHIAPDPTSPLGPPRGPGVRLMYPKAIATLAARRATR